MLTSEIQKFKKRLKESYVLGLFSKTCDPAFVEAMGYGGFDFIIIDLEHGPNSVETIQNLIRAAQVANIFPIVRVNEENPSIIGKVLDIGAGGIQVPKITNAEEVKKIMELAKFAPRGNRGICRFVRAADYSAMDRYRYFKKANETIIILQLEGAEAIENLESIIQVEGIDIVFLGPYDLSQSLGIAGQLAHPLLAQKMTEMAEKCLAKGIAVGTFVETPESAKKWKVAGISYLSYSVDIGIFYEGCREINRAIRGD